MRVLILTWRDGGHPEAGGSETFVERVSDGLGSLGHDVTILTAGYEGAAADEHRSGRTYRRRGGRYSVYARAATHLVRHGGRYDVVLDVQNGVPFWTPLWTRTPVVDVVHHVHREQWPEVFGPLRARLGWLLESQVAPRVYRSAQYLTVSDATRQELVTLGVPAENLRVVYSGNDLPDHADRAVAARTPYPSMVVLGRLVPHKRVELALEALARHRLLHPGLRLTVVGHGYWEADLRARATELGVSDAVEFSGFVDDETKRELLEQAWVHLLPSVKEGWGLVVLEAGFHRTPTVAFRAAGGTTESIVDGVTGLLAENDEDFLAGVARLLDDAALRDELGRAARDHAQKFSWEGTAAGVEAVLAESAGRQGRRRSRRPTQPPSDVSASRT